MNTQPIQIQCVYGSSHVKHLTSCFIPALRNTTERAIRLLTINFDPESDTRLQSSNSDGLEVVDVKNTSSHKTGFGENHNTLFKAHEPDSDFVIINPDCIPQKGSIDALIKCKQYSTDRVGIVEGRQWPFEHPKEYDPLSLETPWASGAFCLIDATFYKRVGGMAEVYFLYLEDVDLSWQAWLNGYTVLYEPGATVTHFSGGRFYREDLISSEHYLGLRNFLIISRKFFGHDGERRAVEMLRAFPDRELADSAIDEYFNRYQTLVSNKYAGASHRHVKILGLNRFHVLRTE